MSTSKHDIRLSRALSFLLRHEPDVAGLTLEPDGWASIEDLLPGLARMGRRATADDLARVVAGSDKRRFELSEDGRRIRARYGHSVDVDLGMHPASPPPALYHGSAQRSLSSILAQGIRSQSRRYVHLSTDRALAVETGRRHGAPVLLVVDAAAMQAEGHRFYTVTDVIWLVRDVPARFVRHAEI